MMGGTKIFVLQLKDLIRIGLFTLLGLALIILLLVLLVPRGRSQAPEDEAAYPAPAQRFVPGTYVSRIILNGEPVQVRVTVSQNDILVLYLAGMDETQRTFYPLFEPRMRDLAEEVLRHQTVAFSPRTDYPVTTGILRRAVADALGQAYYDCCCNRDAIEALRQAYNECCCDEAVVSALRQMYPYGTYEECCCDEAAAAAALSLYPYYECCCDEAAAAAAAVYQPQAYYEDCCCSGVVE